MKEVDYERSRAKVAELGSSAERPWHILDGARIEFGDMPPVPDQALQVVMRARQARPLAESYRGFGVGACAMVRRAGRAIAFSYGVNMKDAPGESAVDLHAEEIIIQSLRPGDEVTSLALSAPYQADQGSGVASETLHPCTYRCLPMLAESTQVGADALIFCTTADGTRLEWGTVSDFQAYHQGEPARVTSVSFESMPQVLMPVLPADEYDLSDQALDIDTTDWDSKVKIPLVEWAYQRRYAGLGHTEVE